MLQFKLKLALRNFLKNKVYSALIIGGFSIGFTAFILIVLFYNTEHNVDNGFLNHKNIYRLYDTKRNTCNLDYKLNTPLSEKYPEVENTCPMEYSTGFKTTIKDPETKKFTQVDHLIVTNNNFFDIFSVKLVASLSDKPFNDLNSMVITETVAKRLYGDKNPLGLTLKTDFFSGVISAVIKDLPPNSSFKAELLLNSENKDFQMSQACNNGVCIYPTSHFIELKNNADVAEFTKKLNATIKTFNSNVDNLSLQSLTNIYLSKLSLQDSNKKGNSNALIIFLSIGILIILLSSINYLNYTISMQYAKMKEIGINKINGASRWQLVSNSLIEITLGIVISILISILLTSLLLPYTKIIFGHKIILTYVNFFQLIPVFTITIIGIIILNSLAPIYILSRFNITNFLNKGLTLKGKQLGIQVMSTFQLTVSIILIAVVTIIFRQLQFVNNYDLGFNKKHLIKIEIPYLYPNPTLIKKEMDKISFVSGSTLSDGNPGNIKLLMGSGAKEQSFMLNCIYISDDYIKTMGIHLTEGRDFLKSDKDKACLLNKEAIKQYGWNDINNKKYNNGSKSGYNVIGVINNFNVQSLHSNIKPVALIYDPNHRFDALSLKLKPGNIRQQIKQLKNTWNELMPEEPFNFQFYDNIFQAMYAKDLKLGQSIAFFSLIAVILTCMGILGQIFLICLNKTKEIGIRKVNGAKVLEVILMLNKGFIKWVFVAFIIATPIAYYAMYKWLENFAYKTHLNWWIFVLAGILTLVITLLIVSWQSFRYATINPVEALKNE